MRVDPDIAGVAALVADPSRTAMLMALMEGAPLAAGELARRAGVSASTASSHLARLEAGRLIVCEPSGRLRRYRLASRDVARLLEAAAVLAPGALALTTDARDSARSLRLARTCYDHLAGWLGCAITDTMVQTRVLRRSSGSFAVTASGRTWLGDLGIAMAVIEGRRRPLARACLDWSERRPHVAGALGAALTAHILERGWVRRVRSSRAVRVTDRGILALGERFGIALGPGAAQAP